MTTYPNWIATAGSIEALDALDSVTAKHFFNKAAAFCAGGSLTSSPTPTGYAATPVLSYTSYAAFAADISAGNIKYAYKWVMYDPEKWSGTPQDEQNDPWTYMADFGTLANTNGYNAILIPGLDLAYVTTSVNPLVWPETADQWWQTYNLPGAAAGTSGQTQIYVMQNESDMPSGGQYKYMFHASKTLAQTANSACKCGAEISMANLTTVASCVSQVESLAAYNPDYMYLAVAGDASDALTVMQDLKTAGY